jgi:hypothetical protein
MTSYLVFVIVYYHIFEDFPRARNVDFKKEPTFVWYLVLWRHKSPYNFYAVQNGFMSAFKKMIHGPTASRLCHWKLHPFSPRKEFLKLWRNLVF